jgi:hypothetical protein
MKKRLPNPHEVLAQPRPYAINLSLPEVLALVRYHMSEQRKLSNKVGAVIAANTFSPSDMKSGLAEVRAHVVHHQARAKGLLAIAKELAEKGAQ